MNAPTQNDVHLLAALDRFRSDYGALRVVPRPMDLTAAFWSDEAGRHVAPRAYGDLPAARVMGYATFGAALISKFEKDANGRVIRDDGIPRIRDFSTEQIVMACLCVHDMRNTSLFEIADALEGTHRIQGYRRWHLRKLTGAIRQHHPDFSPEADSVFLFAGAPEKLQARIALNAFWLEQVARMGSACADHCSAHEAEMMQAVFPKMVLAGDPDSLRRHSYMWDRPLWEPLSALFLARKVTARLTHLQQEPGRI